MPNKHGCCGHPLGVPLRRASRHDVRTVFGCKLTWRCAVCRGENQTAGPQPYMCPGVGAAARRWPVPHEHKVLLCVECLRKPLSAFRTPWAPREDQTGKPAWPWAVTTDASAVPQQATALYTGWAGATRGLVVLGDWLQSEAVQVLLDVQNQASRRARQRARLVMHVCRELKEDDELTPTERLQWRAAGATAALAAGAHDAWRWVEEAVAAAHGDCPVPALLLWCASVVTHDTHGPALQHLLDAHTSGRQRDVVGASTARSALLVLLANAVQLRVPHEGVHTNCQALLACTSPREAPSAATPVDSPLSRAKESGRRAAALAQAESWDAAADLYAKLRAQLGRVLPHRGKGRGAHALHGEETDFARRVAAELLVRQTDCLLMANRPADASVAASAALAADPGRGDATVHLAWARTCGGQVDEGARDLLAALQTALQKGDKLAARLARRYLKDLHAWAAERPQPQGAE